MQDSSICQRHMVVYLNLLSAKFGAYSLDKNKIRVNSKFENGINESST